MIGILSREHFPTSKIHFQLCKTRSHFMDHVYSQSYQRSREARDEAFHLQYCYRARQIKRLFTDFVCAERCYVCKDTPSSVSFLDMNFHHDATAFLFKFLYNSWCSPCLFFIFQASQVSLSLHDSSGTSGALISSPNSKVPAPNPSAVNFPRALVCTRSSVNPIDGPIEHCTTLMVAQNAHLKITSIPLQEADRVDIFALITSDLN